MKSGAVVAISIKHIEGDWDAKEFVDKATGKFYRVYRYKNKPCTRVTLNSKLCDQLAGYSLIEKDLRSALIWLKKIDEMHTNPTDKHTNFATHSDRDTYNMIKGLFVAALTFYGKCFSKCEGRPVKLERIQLEEKYRNVHEIAISYRHNFAAHSGAKKLEFVTISLVGPEKVKRGRDRPLNLYRELNQPDLIWASNKDELWFLQLFEHAREIVRKKIKFLSEKIMTDEVLSKAPDHFFK